MYYGGVIMVSTLGVMYLRGWKITDLLYVTRAGLQKSMAGVTTSEGPLHHHVIAIMECSMPQQS